jgi:hypothetical protein
MAALGCVTVLHGLRARQQFANHLEGLVGDMVIELHIQVSRQLRGKMLSCIKKRTRSN